METRKGYFKLVTIRRVPIYVYWSLPLLPMLAPIFEGYEPHAFLYFILGFVLIVIVHEAGHVLAALALRLKIVAVDLSAGGGMCHVELPPRMWQSMTSIRRESSHRWCCLRDANSTLRTSDRRSRLLARPWSSALPISISLLWR